jgi:hypothetical protein
MKVRIVYIDGKEEFVNNLSEIHYNYGKALTAKERVAFESKELYKGFSRKIDEIKEFEIIND